MLWDNNINFGNSNKIKRGERTMKTLKECKKMFDDYNEKLKEFFCQKGFHKDMGWCSNCDEIDKLSKEVLEE